MKRWFVGCVAMMATAGTITAGPKAQPQQPVKLTDPMRARMALKDKVDAAVSSAKGKDWYVGLIVAIVTPDHPEGAVYYYGERTIHEDHHAPVDANTAFRIGSVTKTFTATLLAVDAASGCVRVSNPCSGRALFVPTTLAEELAKIGAKPLPDARANITLEELASHHSGLPRKATRDVCTPDDVLDVVADCVPDSKTQKTCKPGVVVARAECPEPQTSYPNLDGTKTCGVGPKECPSQAPGAMFIYSNFGFNVLGAVLAKSCKDAAGDTDWFAVTNALILQPLGMAHTFTWDAPPANAPPQAAALHIGAGYSCDHKPDKKYDDKDYPTCQSAFAKYPSADEPAGGLWSTGADMLVWLKYLAGVKPTPTSASIDTLYGERALLQCPRADGGDGINEVGLAWQLKQRDSRTVVSKDGAWSGFHTWIGYMPDAGVGVVVMSNSDGSTGAIGEAVLDKLR